MITLIDKLNSRIKNDDYFLDENKEIIREKVKTASLNLDEHLMSILLSDEEFKKAFFIEKNGILVFDKVKFSWIISNNNFLPDSYTSYKNKIGLIDSYGDFLKSKDDVVLSFPYKDCVLEFDSTKENEDRDEVFLNEILSKDYIDTLLSPKAFEKPVLHEKNGNKSVDNYNGENLVIKGNNLISLFSLLPRFEGRIKCMYWDILYNTNSDKVPYNDKFKHSSWLTMMKNRLEVAKRLLKNDGTICIQCDDNEMAYLKVLCDEIFDRDNHVNTICVKMSELKGFKMGNLSNKFPKLKEYILIYAKDKSQVQLKIETVEKDNLESYMKYYNKRIKNINDPCEQWEIELVDRNYDKIAHAEEMIYIVTRDSKIDEALPVNQFIEKVDSNGKKSYIIYDGRKINTVLFLSDYIKEPVGDIWMDISTININKESSVQLPNGKKPESLLKRIIYSLTNEGDYVLDAYFGTGTTGAVAMKMNRKFIGLEQLDTHYEKSIKRLEEVINGDKSGVSEEVGWNGGGSFVSCELSKYNQNIINEIINSSSENIMDLYNKIINSPFLLNYRVDLVNMKEFKNIEEFKLLTLKEKQKVLIDILDKNILYVNLSEIDDESKEVTEVDKNFTRSFYGE